MNAIKNSAKIINGHSQVPAHASDSDFDILELVIIGNMNRAVHLLMRRHGEDVHRYCCKQLNDVALADDVRQEIFIAALRDLPRFEGRSTLRTWLFAIARHRTSNAKRRIRRNSNEVELTEIVNRHDPSPSPIDSLDEIRLRGRLIASIRLLPEGICGILVLRYFGGFTYDEIATIFGEKPSKLQARLSRALGRLRLAIAGDPYGVCSEEQLNCAWATEDFAMPTLLQQVGGMAKLLKMAQQAGGMAKLLDLAREAGGFEALVKMATEAGGFDKLLELAKGAGGIPALLQAARDAGGFEQLVKMAQQAGGFPKLMDLARECGGPPKLVQLAKDIGVAKVKEYLDILKAGERISDPVKTLEDLINEFKSAQKLDLVFDLSRDAAHGGKIMRLIAVSTRRG